MRARAAEERLPDEGFREEKLNVLLRPVTGRERLQEHHDLLVEVKLSEHMRLKNQCRESVPESPSSPAGRTTSLERRRIHRGESGRNLALRPICSMFSMLRERHL